MVCDLMHARRQIQKNRSTAGHPCHKCDANGMVFGSKYVLACFLINEETLLQYEFEFLTRFFKSMYLRPDSALSTFVKLLSL